MEILLGILIAIVVVVFILVLFFSKRKLTHATEEANALLQKASSDAASAKKEMLIEAKEEAYAYRLSQEDELRKLRDELEKSEAKLEVQKEKVSSLESDVTQKNKKASEKLEELDQLEQALKQKRMEVKGKLEELASLSKEEAKVQLLEEVKRDADRELLEAYTLKFQQFKKEYKKKASQLLVEAMQKLAMDNVSERTVSVVSIPDDELKGRIIGREGRNIRALEAATGVDFIIDDTPEVIAISSFSPLRREIAKRTLEKLISDGRIHPSRIEDVVKIAERDVDTFVREIGASTTFELRLNNMHADLEAYVGQLYFRTSYGQNMLDHSREVAHICGIIASELGLDVELAKRVGLLHDIGKTLTHEHEGSHVDLGVSLVKKFGEKEVVRNAIASHHGDVPVTSIYGEIVILADTLSASKPGARSESFEEYIKRLEQLEAIAKKYPSVEQSYAISAGRELRVIVKPDKITDFEAIELSKKIKTEIEETMTYPGNIQVTVIREIRAVQTAT